MAVSLEWLALAVSLLGVILSSALAYLVYSSGRQSQRAEAARSIGSLYDKMMDFRGGHPEVLALSRSWTVDCFERIYRQDEPSDVEWAQYYTYAELCCGFVNEVLDSRDAGLLRKRTFERHYKRLVTLILTEHYPYLVSASQDKYLSEYITDFLKTRAAEGWDWSEMHRVLPGPNELPLLTSLRPTT